MKMKTVTLHQEESLPEQQEPPHGNDENIRMFGVMRRRRNWTTDVVSSNFDQFEVYNIMW
jgi:hypothetical protein